MISGCGMKVFAVTGLIHLLSVACVTGSLDETDTQVAVADTSVNKTQTNLHLYINGLFEGDLKISADLIRKVYNFSSIPGGEELFEELEKVDDDLSGPGIRDERAAGSDIKLWSNNIVRYQFSSNIPTATANLIRNAMDHWEDNTCLRFLIHSGQNDYIEYDNTDSGCYSTSVGKAGGKQTINLQTNDPITTAGCEYHEVIVHEIGHAVGFWHEQSRPDRNSYLTINFNNIENDEHPQFMIRNDFEIDYQGSGFDYGSIMQYEDDAFVRPGCAGCKTMQVNNQAEYNRQGRPTLGAATQLSNGDIEQSNRLYSCPNSGILGFLMIRAIQGRSLPDTDPILNNPDPYVKFTAVNSDGNKHQTQTSTKTGTTNPNWNEWKSFAESAWQFFRMRVWDEDYNADDAMSMSQTVVVESGDHYNLRHCVDTACSGYTTFEYRLIPLMAARLRVKIRRASNLPDTDPIFNYPDPYVKIDAMKSTKILTSMTSRVITGTINPTWDQWLDFGCSRWVSFDIQIWDSDSFFTGSDDEMSTKQNFMVQQGSYTNIRHNANGGGSLIFDYELTANANSQCSPNPCQNRGTCVDYCSGFTCFCAPGYTGSRCEHSTGILRFFARRGYNLPDEDGIWNLSDPYMQFTAIDASGNSVTMTTSVKIGTLNPEWNEHIHFEKRAWTEFRVRVYDSDFFSDDVLCGQRSWNLRSHTSQSFVRLGCNSGYVNFDYTFK